MGLTDSRGLRLDAIRKRRPVLIAWATSDEVPELAGRIAGIGGSVAAGKPGRLRYITGIVVLDREVFVRFGPGDREGLARLGGVGC